LATEDVTPQAKVQFYTYSMMEATHNQILHFENVDKREVGLHSPNMEREEWCTAIEKISEVVTDSSTSVAKTLGNL